MLEILFGVLLGYCWHKHDEYVFKAKGALKSFKDGYNYNGRSEK